MAAATYPAAILARMVKRRVAHIALGLAAAALATALAACGAPAESTSGAAFQVAQTMPATSSFSESEATGSNGALIDASHSSQGYVGASAQASSRLKLLVVMGDATQTYDMSQDGTPIIAPLTFGSGSYTIRVMQNTSGDSYVELAHVDVTVELDDEFAPYLRPNVYCDYDEASACVAKARELVGSATNQGEALEAICDYICSNVTYDDGKASQLQSSSGYVPDPDDTLAEGKGICFDYACLGAAMLRSQGIPTKVVTGYVSPDNIYHAWIEVYIDGTWVSAAFNVQAKTWSRLDLTFAAAGAGKSVGDGKEYTPRYVY